MFRQAFSAAAKGLVAALDKLELQRMEADAQ
jgi:hypothetical protein